MLVHGRSPIDEFVGGRRTTWGKQRVAGRDPEATREPGRDLNLPSSGEDEHGDAQAWGVLMAVVEVIAD